MRRSIGLIGLVTAVWLAGAGVSMASPITIGTFAYDVDSLFGPVLTVYNTSNITTPGTFSGVTIDIPDSSSPIQSIPLGTISAGNSVQTSEDLTGFPFSSARVTLTFTPVATPSVHVTAQAFLSGLTLDVDGSDWVGDSVDTPITIDSGRLAPVPEPGSLILLSSGLATLVQRVARRRRRADKPRDKEAAARRFSP